MSEKKRIADLEEAVEDLLYQFAFNTDNGELWTGGLSALEFGFEVLGWSDPHPLPQDCLCETSGCPRRSTCGLRLPLEDGRGRIIEDGQLRYARLCSECAKECNYGEGPE